MQQQTITMMTNIGVGKDINNNNQQQQIHSTGPLQMPIMKQEDLNDQQQQQHHQFNQLQQHQPLHQPLPITPHQHQHPNQQHQAQAQQQQQPQQNGPKPRGRRKKIRTEPIRPICPQCEKQFSNQSALTKHKLTHSDERKFACQQCSKAFKRHDHLTGHMQTHSNRKPFNCTIQGCDKTYCDARSLRRHKENIHHIVTQAQEPSHLLKRRIQRLHSDQGGYNRSVEHHQLNCVTAPPHSLPPQTSLTPQQVTTTTTTTPTPNGNSNSSSSSNNSNHQIYLNHHHGHVNQHGSYSADYASTQHFSFDFVPVNGGSGLDVGQSVNHHHHHHHPHPQAGSHQNLHQRHHHHSASHHHPHHHQHPPHASSLEHVAGAGRGMPPHSADSIADSGLGLNVRYEELPTLQPLPPPPPPSSARPTYQQPHRQQPQHYISYSAGYQSTEHFDFDFVTSKGDNNNHHQSTSFDFEQMNNHHSHHHHASSLDQTNGGQGVQPHSADSIADSGLGLNMRYEELTPQSLPPPPPPTRPYQHHHRQPPQHNVSYSAGYQTTEHFDFDFVTSTSNNNHHQSTSFDFEQMNNHVCANE